MEEKIIKNLENKGAILENKDKAIREKEKQVLKQEEKVIDKEEKKLKKEQTFLEQKEKIIAEKAEKIKIAEDIELIEQRKKKVISFFKENPFWIFFAVLVILVIMGVNIRMQPLLDHGGNPGLWDATTNDYTLGPDLDPFLFLRGAKSIINNGSLPVIDYMRNVPLGFDNSLELPMVSYLIVLTYKLVNLFGNYSINYAGAFLPVWAFALTIIAFFFFVREIFLRKEDDEHKNKIRYIKASLIASIATFFMIVIPEFLPRTVAGIPEKESVAFLFMFLSFYLFLKAWKSEKIIYSSIFGILAGISTGLMGLTWGGVSYVYLTIGLSCLIAFVLNKFELKETISYGLWLISAFIISMIFTNRYSLTAFVTSIDTGLACFMFGLTIIHLILWKTQFANKLKLDNIKLPKTIISFLIFLVLGIITLLIINPTLIIEKIKGLYHTLIKPTTGRWNTTVAENRQPYFSEWAGSFGPTIGKFPILFWLFFAGSIVLFYNLLKRIKNKDRIILSILYVFFFFGLVFSRYAPHPTLLDGESFVSLVFYFGSALLLVGAVIYYYIKYYKGNDKSFELIQFEYILLFSLLILCLFTARSGVRLIMVLAPIAPIFLAYLIVKTFYNYKNSKESTSKIVILIILILILILTIYAGFTYYKSIKERAYSSVPYYYTIQWQNAMSWVRDNTATNAVFAHWWDYGYWVQSIGNRATVTDGGNAIVWWNYFTGRLVLTGDNQKESLEFLYSHNANYLLIDSSDIGKYAAFSQIGSDENYDRLSQGPITFFSDIRQVQEKKNETVRSYTIPSGNGQVALSSIEEDITYEVNDSKTTLFKENSAIMGFLLTYSQEDLELLFKQPEAIFYSGGKQVTIPLRYVYYNNQFIDYKTGLNAAVRIIPKVSSTSIDQMGALIYVSPRVLRGYLGQVYILNNVLGNFNNFKLVHSERDLFSNNLIAQGYDLDEFVYFDNVGLTGPIKIWKIEYTGNEKINEDYLAKMPPSTITWTF